MGSVGVEPKVRDVVQGTAPDKPVVGIRQSEGSSPSKRDYRATNLCPVGSVVLIRPEP